MANFTQQELVKIQEKFDNIKTRINLHNYSSNMPDDKPIADGYAMMADLLKQRLKNDDTLSEAERKELNYVMTWFQGAERVNRGKGAFSTMIRTYSDKQGELRYGSPFDEEMMQRASNKIGLNAFQDIEELFIEGKTIPLLNMQYIARGLGSKIHFKGFSRNIPNSTLYKSSCL